MMLTAAPGVALVPPVHYDSSGKRQVSRGIHFPRVHSFILGVICRLLSPHAGGGSGRSATGTPSDIVAA